MEKEFLWKSIVTSRGKYPEERQGGKMWHSEGMDNNQVERIFKKMEETGERRCGLRGEEG